MGKINAISRLAILAVFCLCFARLAAAQMNEKQFQDLMTKYLASDAGQDAVGKTMEAYINKKRQEQQQAGLEEQFKNPAKIDVGSSPVKGPANAKITVIEFSDFQCPFCKRGRDTAYQIMEAYPKDVKFAFKHFPLPMHKEAEGAAKAAWAAQQQGKFWEMHDALFENQGKLGSEFYLEEAKTLGLNVDKFKKDMESEAATKAVAADKEVGEKNGIQGTPGFFVNGVAVKGAYPLEHFKMIIDRLLGKTAPAAEKK